MIRLSTARARISRRLPENSDGGFTIVEALVAIVIFMLISVGVAQAMVNAVRLSGDGQHRSVAVNLAATELDRLKALNNPYGIESTATPIVTAPIDGVTYSLTRTASWVDVTGNEISCAVASGNFQLLKVRVNVDWGGRMPGSSTASASTTISPQNTILSPTTATLFISVNKADGTPYPGLTPKVVGPSGTVANVPATNNDGCSYLSGIVAGNYTVTVTTANGISSDQTAIAAANPVTTVVTAGSAVSVPFSYDQQSTLQMSYGPAVTLAPYDLITTFSATSQKNYFVSGTPSQVNLFPVSSGYSVVAGRLLPSTTGATPYVGCLSPDPANWTAGRVGSTQLKAGVDPANASAVPGGSALASAPMGTATFTTLGSGYVRITSATATAQGDPGCAPISGAPAQTYTYRIPFPGTYTLAIPYGSWTSTASGSQTGTYSPFSLQPTSNAYSTPASSTFTIDPRTT